MRKMFAEVKELVELISRMNAAQITAMLLYAQQTVKKGPHSPARL